MAEKHHRVGWRPHPAGNIAPVSRPPIWAGFPISSVIFWALSLFGASDANRAIWTPPEQKPIGSEAVELPPVLRMYRHPNWGRA